MEILVNQKKELQWRLKVVFVWAPSLITKSPVFGVDFRVAHVCSKFGNSLYNGYRV